jgi:hypothetical protein
MQSRAMREFSIYSNLNGKCILKEEGVEVREFINVVAAIAHAQDRKGKDEAELTIYDESECVTIKQKL